MENMSMDETVEYTEKDIDFGDLFLSEHESDIMFTFPNGEKTLQRVSEERYPPHASYPTVSHDNMCCPEDGFPAHTFLLCKQSAVFQAMFNGPLADDADKVMIEDIEPEIMKELLRFVYRGRSNLNGHNVLHCLYAANKYDIAGLKEQCVTFLIENLDTENVCSTHKQAVFFALETLERLCFEFILEHATEVFKTNGFFEVSHAMLLELVKSDYLMDEEENIFNACIGWSENQCKANNVEINPEHLRSSLGEIIYQIRFPNMCKDDFWTVVAPTKVLTSEEEQEISDYLETTFYIYVDKFTNAERTGRFITVETQDYKFCRNIPVFGCHLSMEVQSGIQTVCDSDTPLLLLTAVSGSFVERLLNIYHVQHESQRKVLIEDYKKSDENETLADEQNGFRKDRSCEDHIFILNSIVRNNEQVFTAYIDLKKAFDFVNRDMMLYKLLVSGVDGKLYENIKAMYERTMASIKINGKLTNWFDCKSGVAQGNNLSPTIFATFINDIVREINDLDIGFRVGDTSVSLLLYADDIVLIADSEQKLQTMLDKLHQWCKKWRVLINTDKSKSMHFRRGRTRRTDFQFHIGNNNLENVAEYRYLGVLFTEKGNFTEHCAALSKSGGRALGGIINKIHGLKDIGFKTYDKLYYSCVVPVLDYCSGVWGFKQYQSADNVQNRAIRYFLGVHRFAPVTAISGEVGWLPSRYRRWINMLRYWNRLNLTSGDRLLKKIFETDYTLRHNNWASEVKTVMDTINLGQCFLNKTLIDLPLAKSKINEHYHHQWLNSLQSLPKLRTYRLFKSDFKAEKYVVMNLSKNERSTLAQFRCGILPLRIETGRYVNEPLHERICTQCNNGEIESEMHFLLHCPMYDNLRIEMYKDLFTDPIFSCKTLEDKLSILLNDHTRKTSKFLTKAILIRRGNLYR